MIIFFSFGSPILYKYMGLVLIIFVISECLCFILLFLIVKALRRNLHTFSKHTYRMHVQFTCCLASQILSPLLYIFVPVCAGIITALNSLKPTKLLVDISLLCIIFYGLSNSLLTIVFVSPYRKYFLNVLIFPWLKPVLRVIGCKNSTSTRVQVLRATIVTAN
jgi:hypothetical protein